MREIFRLATANESREQTFPAETGGWTLEELQRIGEEAGIEPARVAQAVARLHARGEAVQVRRSAGMPIGVSHMVDLPRAPTDREWEQMVAELRTMFGVKGQTANSGGIRDWSQGNLHIAVEPTERGHQLRMSTRKEDALVFNGMAMLFGGMALVLGGVVTAAGKPEKALLAAGMFGSFAFLALLANIIRLPKWARTRERQMQAIAERAVRLLSGAPD